MGRIATSVISGVIGTIVGAAGVSFFMGKEATKKTEKVEKFRSYYNVLNHWLILNQQGKCLKDFFVMKQYKTIAIYGMGELGNRLYDELKNTNVSVKYAIDQEPETAYSELKVVSKNEISSCEHVDVIVVTPVFAFDYIEGELKELINCPIISLEDIIYGI